MASSNSDFDSVLKSIAVKINKQIYNEAGFNTTTPEQLYVLRHSSMGKDLVAIKAHITNRDYIEIKKILEKNKNNFKIDKNNDANNLFRIIGYGQGTIGSLISMLDEKIKYENAEKKEDND